MNGKTVFITGGSRGIGLAIVKKLASNGANIIIAAKTTDSQVPSLPGTIYTAAKEIEEIGGRLFAQSHVILGLKTRVDYCG